MKKNYLGILTFAAQMKANYFRLINNKSQTAPHNWYYHFFAALYVHAHGHTHHSCFSNCSTIFFIALVRIISLFFTIFNFFFQILHHLNFLFHARVKWASIFACFSPALSSALLYYNFSGSQLPRQL